MEIINELNAIPLGMMTGFVISVFILLPILNRYWENFDKKKTTRELELTKRVKKNG